MKHRQESNEQIVADPIVMLGKSIVRSTCVPVHLIVGLVEAGKRPS